MLPRTRTCKTCSDHLPLDKEHFKYRKDKDWLSHECLVCLNKRRNEQSKLARNNRQHPVVDSATNLFLYGR